MGSSVFGLDSISKVQATPCHPGSCHRRLSESEAPNLSRALVTACDGDFPRGFQDAALGSAPPAVLLQRSQSSLPRRGASHGSRIELFFWESIVQVKSLNTCYGRNLVARVSRSASVLVTPLCLFIEVMPCRLLALLVNCAQRSPFSWILFRRLFSLDEPRPKARFQAELLTSISSGGRRVTLKGAPDIENSFLSEQGFTAIQSNSPLTLHTGC